MAPLAPDSAGRLDKLRRFMKRQDLQGIVIGAAVNVRYLTGFTGDSTFALLGTDEALLVSDGRYSEQLAQECPDWPCEIRPPSLPLIEAVARALQHLGWRRLGFESHRLTVAEWLHLQDRLPEATWCPLASAVEDIRVVKDAYEIAYIREAVQTAEKAFQEWLGQVESTATEKELADHLETALRRHGAQSSSFPIIVASGTHSALPHARPRPVPVADADWLLVDWGAVCHGYHSDLTRILIARTISAKLEEVRAWVREALERGLQAARPGARASDVDSAVRRTLAEAGYDRFFCHGTGHGLGLEIHEAPFLRPGHDTLLQPGMVFTIEPGVYIPGWGGVRLEEDILVTTEGCQVLSQLDWRLKARG